MNTLLLFCNMFLMVNGHSDSLKIVVNNQDSTKCIDYGVKLLFNDSILFESKISKGDTLLFPYEKIKSINDEKIIFIVYNLVNQSDCLYADIFNCRELKRSYIIEFQINDKASKYNTNIDFQEDDSCLGMFQGKKGFLKTLSRKDRKILKKQWKNNIKPNQVIIRWK